MYVNRQRVSWIRAAMAGMLVAASLFVPIPHVRAQVLPVPVSPLRLDAVPIAAVAIPALVDQERPTPQSPAVAQETPRPSPPVEVATEVKPEPPQSVVDPAYTSEQMRAKIQALVKLAAAQEGGTVEPEEFGKGAYKSDTPGLVDPKVKHAESPMYTSAAMREKIQGRVTLKVVVKANGTVGDVRIVKSLDATLGLDKSAIEAAKKWTFEPATLYGLEVPVIIELDMEFRLH